MPTDAAKAPAPDARKPTPKLPNMGIGAAYAALSFSLLLVVAFLAVICIAEITARQSMLSLLNSRVAALKSEFVDLNRGANVREGAASRDGDERTSLLEGIRRLEQIRIRLHTLVTVGSANRELSLRATQTDLNAHLAGSSTTQIKVGLTKPENQKDGLASTTSKHDSGTGAGTSFVHQAMMNLSEPLHLNSSDLLLAIAMMSCGAMGAMIVGLRSNSSFGIRSFSLGIATGFVVYLAIKGGKHLFLLQTGDEIVSFNPYGSAFAALLAGLFSEKAYEALSTVADDFLLRLRGAASDSNRSTKGS